MMKQRTVLSFQKPVHPSICHMHSFSWKYRQISRQTVTKRRV